jgi:hypothetical protein
MKPGRPRDPNSNMGKMRAFFEANPDEELTFEDVAKKFDLPPAKVWTLSRILKREGVCETAYVIRAKRPT